MFCSLWLLTAPSGLSAQEKEKEKGKEKSVSKYDRANAEYLLIEAQKFFLLEDYERTLAFLEQSLEVDAKNHAAYFKRAETFLVTEKYDQGLKAIEKAQELVPDNKYYYILAAQLYKAKEDLAGAAGEYEQMLANTKDYKEYLLDLVDIYVALENYDKALSALEETEKAFKTPDKFLVQKKDLLVQSGRSDEAASYIKTLLDNDTNNAELLTEYSALMTQIGKEAEVMSYLEQIEPAATNAKPVLLRLYLRNGLFDKATPQLTAVIKDRLLNLEQKLELAQDLLALNEPESLSLLQKLSEHIETQAPDDARTLEIQSGLLSKLAQGENSDKANLGFQTLDILVRLIEKDPSSFQNWKKLLEYHFENENWSDLAEESLGALDYFPNQGLFYFYSGSASLYTGEQGDAEDLLNQSMRLSFSNDSLKARTLGKMAELSFAQGQNDQAIKHFDEALALLRLPEIINNYSLELALRQIDLEKAMALATEADTMQPNQLRYINTKALVRFQLGEYDQAKALLEEGLGRLPDQVDGPILEQYGDVLMKLNLVEQAVEQWQKAKELGNTSGKLDQKIANKEYF